MTNPELAAAMIRLAHLLTRTVEAVGPHRTIGGATEYQSLLADLRRFRSDVTASQRREPVSCEASYAEFDR